MTSSLSIDAWLATYAIHSTILLVSALIVSRFMTSENARDVLWKAALLGGFVTSLVPAITGITPFVGRWNVGGTDERIRTPVATTEGAPAASPSITSGAAARSNLKAASYPVDGRRPFAVRPQLTAILIAAWIVGSLLLIARLVFHQRRILRALRDRHRVSDGRLPEMLAELRRKSAVWTPVRLSTSEACPTPIALGRSEICVPARFSSDLDVEQQRNALAHELAHLKRRDPLWQMGAGVIESVFFFQPLNIIARRKLRESSEYLADDWAVQQTSSPLALARCLTQISSWVGSVPVPDGMLAMAEGGSPLVSRIERLAEWRRSSSAPARVTVLVAAAFIALVATSAPTFSAVPASNNEIIASLVKNRRPQADSPDSVIRYAGNRGSLEQRWAMALSQNLEHPRWIGWETDAAPVNGRTAASSTPHLPFPEKGAPTLASLVGSPTASSRQGILVRFNAGPASESGIAGAVFHPMDSPVYLGGEAVIWLGPADARESLAMVQRLQRSSRNPDIRSELAAAFTIHPDADAVIDAVTAVLKSEGSSDVGTEAIQWLARIHGENARAIDLLKTQSLSGRDSDSRVEAVDGLRLVMSRGSAAARAALKQIADSAPDMRIRSEATQSLTRHSEATNNR
jgi:beta-lactamase regulating signal transducer with metallopeptidase domain